MNNFFKYIFVRYFMYIIAGLKLVFDGLLGKVEKNTKLSFSAKRIIRLQSGLLAITIGSFILPDVCCLAQGETIKGEAVIMNASMHNEWRPDTRYMTVTLLENDTAYECRVIDTGFTEGTLVEIEILPFTRYASMTEENTIRFYTVGIVLYLLCTLLFVRSIVETYIKYKRKKKYYVKRITSFSLASIKLKFGEALTALASILLIMGVCFWEALYAFQNYCNMVCIAVAFAASFVFFIESTLMVGAIKCLSGSKKAIQVINKRHGCSDKY